MIEDESAGVAGAGEAGATERLVEKSGEVAPAVGGVMSALKRAAEAFREYEASGRQAAAGLNDGPGKAQKIGMLAGAERNGGLALMCEKAIADLEASLAASFQRVADATDRPKAPPSPSALFRAGFDYGAMAMLYAEIPEDARPARWGEKPAPPASWQDAWALVRGQIATAR